MINRTNKLVTDIFTALLEYKCELPQGNGFSVKIGNLYAMLLLMWWNMDPVNLLGEITPISSPRHGYPLIAGGVLHHVSSLAYVDDAKQFIAIPKHSHTCAEFFNIVQGYCDLLADLSLVIKMGRNVKKCILCLYNIPHDTIIPEFTSIAWSFEARGPMKGTISVTTMRRDQDETLICYSILDPIKDNMSPDIKNILENRKYLSVPTNAQLDSSNGKKKLISKLQQRIAIVSKSTTNIQEAKFCIT
jgi:hypothetical protein